MANTLDWLFQGSAPTPAPIGSDVATGGPLWLQAQTYNLSNAAGNLAGQPYSPFPGPQVAAPSAQTLQSQQLAGQNVGGWNPYLTQAGALTRAATAPITSGDVSQFMNPYQNYITGALNQNLQQNILPGIQDKFVSAGQSRSPQEAQVTGQAIYGTQQAAGQALAGGYQGALSSLLQQRQQQAAGGAQMGTLGALNQSLGITDVGQLAASGQGQDQLRQANLNAALNNFQQQQQWPYQQLGFLSNIERGLPAGGVGQNTQTTGAGYLPPSSYGASPLQTFASSLGPGAGKALGLRRGGLVPRGALTAFRMAA